MMAYLNSTSKKGWAKVKEEETRSTFTKHTGEKTSKTRLNMIETSSEGEINNRMIC